jgi:hypothetical protein
MPSPDFEQLPIAFSAAVDLGVVSLGFMLQADSRSPLAISAIVILIVVIGSPD